MGAALVDLQERILYHQIHPLKLAVDWGLGLVAVYYAWQQNLPLAALIALLPSILVTLYLVQYVDLTPQKNSAFGRYIATYMGDKIQQARLWGYGIMLYSAFVRNMVGVVLGLLVIVFAWTRGWLQERFWPARSK